MKKWRLKRACAALAITLFCLAGAPGAVAEPQRAELHVWGGNEADDSGSFGLRTVEAALWATPSDRLAVRYDNSLSLDNPTLARTGVDAEAYFVSYLHDFDGRWLAQAEVGRRDLPGDSEQDIYKLELVFFNQGAAAKFGVQASPTDTPLGDYTDTVVWGMYNFAVGERWRLEPAIYVAETGAAGDREWRLAGYAEYNPIGERWQLGVGAGFGDIDSDIPGASGAVVNAHARLTWNVTENHSLHAQVRYEDAPLQDYTVGLVGFSLRLPR